MSGVKRFAFERKRFKEEKGEDKKSMAMSMANEKGLGRRSSGFLVAHLKRQK